MLQIRLLGQFDIRLDRKRVTISTRAGQSLLAYLALTAGTAHRREKVAGTFWPDTSDESARKNLRQELWRIRKALSIQRTNTEDYFTASDLTVTFNRDAEYWLDVAQVERPDLDLESLTTNLALYQGELLPGFYDEWIIIERERVQSIYDNKMGQLLEQLIASERWMAVQEQSERWLSMGNSVEPAYRGLMLAYGARGDMAKVSTIYQRCIADLDEKFGLEPSPETRALYDGLLKGSHIASPTTQPSGTVTFLFTDIAGSTKLLDQLKDQYAIVLADHHKIMRAAIQKWNGREVDTQGDAFFVTFSRALDAVQCAAEAQREFASHKWVHNSPLRVRMGLHTGEPLLASTGYVGMDVHRAARIGDAGHGGQVLLSSTTRELVINDLPEDLKIQNLGEHRLKDLRYPTPIHQLVVEGLPSEFPPLRTKFSGIEAPAPGEPPFKGLQYFDEVDSDIFYGRELLTAKLVNHLRETKFLSVVIGASGSGKSSLVRAGLIPALKNERELLDGIKPPEGSSEWQVHIITPTAHPIEALAIELTRDSESLTASATLMDDLMQDPRSLALHFARKNSKQHTLLVLDQFEELFTLCRDEFEREAFIDNLLSALTPSTQENGQRGDGKITLILTLRADFYAHLAQYPELRDAVASQQEYIGPMTMDELRRAIEEPAKRAHWAFEPGLVDLILRDVGVEPGALPLLSHALLETWKRRAGHTLTLKGYADAGGVRGAIAHTAESVYQDLSPEEQVIARDIFLRLTELGEGTEDTRRRVSFDELMSTAEDTNEVRNVLNILAEARLVTLGEGTAEVAHEALIREWPTLREWLNQDREGLQLHRRLTETAREWELLEHDDGVLYRGAQLAQAREWAALHPKALNANEQAFLDTSNAFEENKLAEREAQQRRELEAARKLADTEKQSVTRLRSRNRVITAVGVIALILAIAAMSFSRQSSSNAKTAEENAQSALSAQATAQANEELAKSNAEEAQKIQIQAEQGERTARSRELAAASLNSLDEDPELGILLALESVATTKDTDGTVLRESLEALHASIVSSPIRMTRTHGDIWTQTVVYSPDGKQLASVGESGTVVIWETETGDEIHRIVVSNENDGWLSPGLLAYRPDGEWLVSFDKNLVVIYDPASGKIIKTLEGHLANVTAIAFSRDGKYLATGGIDGSIIIWDGITGDKLSQPLEQGTPIEYLTFSPNEIWLITSGDDSAIKVWDVQTSSLLHEFPIFPPYATNLTFSPSGDRFMYSDWTGVKVWQIDPETNNDPSLLLTEEALTFSTSWGVTISPDGSKIAGAYPGGLKIWDSNTGSEIWRAAFSSSGAISLAFSLDGKFLATSDYEGYVKIRSVLPGNEGRPWDVTGRDFEIQPDGKKLVSINVDNSSATVWDVDTGEPLFSVQSGDALITKMAMSPDGTLFATGDTEGGVKIWDTKTGEQILGFMAGQDGLIRMAFSFDGTRLATNGADRLVRTWNTTTGELLFEDEFPNLAHGLAFSPDNVHFAAASLQGILKVWNVATGELVFSLTGTTPDFSDLSYSSNGLMIASVAKQGQIVLYDALTGSEIQTLEGSGEMGAPMFSPDGKYLAAVGSDIYIWDLDKNSIILSIPTPDGAYAYKFASSGDRLYIAGQGGAIREYLLNSNELLALAQSRVTRSLSEAECQKYLHVDTCPTP